MWSEVSEQGLPVIELWSERAERIVYMRIELLHERGWPHDGGWEIRTL